ncbi:MAG: hypothetical protein DLM54_06290 [Acidimicrobiales bacterium]|nr:MAG: hypothetical protein DLM54_06290 [Acidimicrobiales bacterium]
MNIKSKLVMGCLTALPVFGLGGGLAYASTASSTPPAATVPASSPSSAPNAVNGPSADMPDVGAGAEPKGAPEAPDGSGQESGSAQGSDGPGGHQDPAGNVDHQFNGQE